MKVQSPKSSLFEELSSLYSDMERAYNRAAAKIGLTCTKCPDNCCTSYFQHHTYIEWAYLWIGVRSCPDETRRQFMTKADEYVKQCRTLLAQRLRPEIMCPLNNDGLCQLYEYRLMICRLHGVPHSFIRPDGKKESFPGCLSCQALCSDLEEVPVLDRTPFYHELASLEKAFTGDRIRTLPRAKLTLAEMLIQGPPRF